MIGSFITMYGYDGAWHSSYGTLNLNVAAGPGPGPDLILSGTIDSNYGAGQLNFNGPGVVALTSTNDACPMGAVDLNGGVVNFAANTLPSAPGTGVLMNGGTLQWATGNSQERLLHFRALRRRPDGLFRHQRQQCRL